MNLGLTNDEKLRIHDELGIDDELELTLNLGLVAVLFFETTLVDTNEKLG